MNFRRYAAVAVLSVLGCSSPNGDGSDTTAVTDRGTAAPEFSGEDLLRGALFGEGPAQQVFADIWSSARFQPIDRASLTDEEYAGLERQIAGTFDRVRANHPHAFESLAAAARSGDRVRIDKSFREDTKWYVEAATAELPADSGAPGTGATGDCIVFDLVAIFEVAVNVAIAVNVQIAYNRTFAWTRPENPQGTGGITTDMIVDAIAVGVKAQ